MKKPAYTFGDTIKIGGQYLVIDEIKFSKGKHDKEPRLFYGSHGHWVEDKYLEDAPKDDKADAVEAKKEELDPDPDGTLDESERAEELDADPDGTAGDDEKDAEAEEAASAPKKTASKKKG